MINKSQHTTHNIANKGLSGMQRFAARFNFLCTLIGNHPQSLTGHIVNVMRQLKKKKS
jgi:hypothetical protein